MGNDQSKHSSSSSSSHSSSSSSLSPSNTLIKHTTLFHNKILVGEFQQKREIEIISYEKILVKDKTLLGYSHSPVLSIDLENILEIGIENSEKTDQIQVNIRDEMNLLQVYFKEYNNAYKWKNKLQDEIYVRKTKIAEQTGHGLDRLHQMIGTLVNDSTISEDDAPISSVSLLEQRRIPSPLLKIVILVVGTRGDVQPFVNLGLELKARGHDVRIATHAEYRRDVTKEGLKYYPLAGDPRKLSEYMVKTAGRLIPDFLNEEERNSLPEKMQMLKEICFSTWPACTMPDPEDLDNTPFVADAIISNPVSYGHIHCAEALAIPMHIMFPQPWYPTKSFPHPLSNMGFESSWSVKNRLSFRMVDEFMWMGLGFMINEFRTDILHLPPLRLGEGGESILINLNVPISHMWSPSFVPKCIDWPIHVDVVGDFTRVKTEATPPPPVYTPDPRLVAFLQSCGDDKPIYIGFGSMVIADSAKLVRMIKDAATATGYPVILQSGWTKYAEDYEMIAEKVMVVGAMPHDYLFSQVCATIHHGGAGTTSAGLRAGNATFICPFFGDQHFWAEMVSRAGAGPRGCPIAELTSEKLTNAFTVLKSDEIKENVKILSEKMNRENGVLNGVESFFANLPVEDMLCEVSLFRRQGKLAAVYCESCGLKLSKEVDLFLHREGAGREDHYRVRYCSKNWGTDPPNAIDELMGLRIDTVARPLKGGGVIVDKVSSQRSAGIVSPGAKSSKRSFFSFNSESVKELPISHVSIPVDLNGLTPEESDIERAMESALKFQEFFLGLDASGDSLVSVDELKSRLPREEAEALFHSADANSDGLLSFSELASTLLASSR